MKQFLKIDRSRVEGWGCDSNYVHDYKVVDESGNVITEGTLRGKPYTPKLPQEFATGWYLPEDQYPDMKGRWPISGSYVFDKMPWERVVAD